MHNDIQLVCFDLGGVLIRLCSGLDHACALAGVEAGIAISDVDTENLFKLIRREEVGGFDNGAYYEAAGPLLGMSAQDCHAMMDAWLCRAFPGIDALIDSVNRAGLQSACLSNTIDSHWRIMNDPSHPNRLPLAKLTYRFASHLVNDRKPNSTIYEHVERATGLPPEAIVFFDDTAENVDAANARGWHACQVTDPEDPAGQMTSYLKRHNLI